MMRRVLDSPRFLPVLFGCYIVVMLVIAML